MPRSCNKATMHSLVVGIKPLDRATMAVNVYITSLMLPFFHACCIGGNFDCIVYQVYGCLFFGYFSSPPCDVNANCFLLVLHETRHHTVWVFFLWNHQCIWMICLLCPACSKWFIITQLLQLFTE